jgi:hypothetical protein
MKMYHDRPTYESGVLDSRPYAERTEIFPIKRKNIPKRTHEKRENAANDKESESIGPSQ